jgi:sugar lactone lactonase YvrE
VSSNGDIWFTDPQYSWFNALTDTAPQLETATYRFTPSTGTVSIVDDSIIQPNGIAFSPLPGTRGAKQTVYITDSGAVEGTTQQSIGPQGTKFNTTGKRTVYAFDQTSNGKHLINKRPLYLAQDWVPDGLKVAANGYICEFVLWLVAILPTQS